MEYVSTLVGSVVTKGAEKLLKSIKVKIDQKEEEGKIKTWAYDGDGDFKYLAGQYEGAAWIRPLVVEGALNLKLLWKKGSEPSKEIKAIYLARFIEMIVGHFSAADFVETKAWPVV